MGPLKSYTACAEDAGSRIDAVLAAHGLYPSRSAAARAVEDGAVYVNGSTVAKKHTLCAGDTVVYEVPDAPEQGPVQGQAIPLISATRTTTCSSSPSRRGLVCHPSVDHADGTLVNALVYHCGVEHLVRRSGRSDAPASCIASTATPRALCLPQTRCCRFGAYGRYPPITRGRSPATLPWCTGSTPRYRDDRLRPSPVRSTNARAWRFANAPRREMRSPRSACSSASSMVRATTATPLSDCKLYTGRTHQIPRSHAVCEASVGGRIPVYTPVRPRTPMRTSGLNRQFLHSFQVGFTQPMTGEDLFFADNLTDDLAAACSNQLASRSLGSYRSG